MNVHQYIRCIRSKDKRNYAMSYLAFLRGKTPEPSHGKLSYMAAQAVRLRIAAFFEEEYDTKNNPN